MRRSALRGLGQPLMLVVLVTSGTYLLVYLYRWEWNRAVVAGVFLVASEVAVAASALLRRLRAIETRLERLTPTAPLSSRAIPPPGPVAAPVLDRVRHARPERSRPFAWLDPTSGTNVFVPVLLGAGAVLSVLAAGMERLAGATATPVLERRLAQRLAPLALPLGGLLASGGQASPPELGSLGRDASALTTPLRPRLVRWAARVAAVALAVVAVTAGIDMLADATQDRPDVATSGQATELTLAVSHRWSGPATLATTERFWQVCRGMVPARATAREVVDLGGGRTRLVIEPALGEYALRRFHGCLEDATFDRVQASVVSLRTVATEDVSDLDE